MTELRTLDTTIEQLHRELVQMVSGQPWKTVALIQLRDGRYAFKYDLGKALADPAFIGFCDLQTSQDRLRQMIAENNEGSDR